MLKETFIIKTKYKSVISKLSDKQAGILFKMLFEYVENGVIAGSTDDRVDMAFDFIKIDLDAFNDTYLKRVEASRNNGRKGAEFGKLGGRPKTPKTPNPVLKTPKTPDNDNDNDNDIKEKINKKENFDFFKSLIAIGVSEQVASDWLKVRKTKKATNTKTAFDRILTEINNSNQSADYCIRIAVEKNWQGFRAEWLNNLTNQKNGTITNARDKGIISHPAEGEDDEITTFGI